VARPPLRLAVLAAALLLVAACRPSGGQVAPAFDAQWATGHLRALAQMGPRPPGSPQEHAAAHYLAGVLSSLGYRVEEQAFPFVLTFARAARLVVGGREVPAVPMVGSAGGQVTGPLADGGQGRPEDLASVPAGAVVLVRRSGVPFSDMAAAAADAGAVALVVYNDRPGPLWGRLREEASIPVLALSGEDGEALARALGRGPPPQAEVWVQEAGWAESENVVARAGQSCRFLLGAHYDSVPASPGANDNASGVAVVLGLARALAGREGACMALFGAEEEGLYGSRHLVATMDEAQREALEAVLVFDMVGVGPKLMVTGDRELAAALRRKVASLHLALTLGSLPPGTDSDHSSFLAWGIPAVLLHRPDDPAYHTPQDTAQRIDPQALAEVAQVAFSLLQEPAYLAPAAP